MGGGGEAEGGVQKGGGEKQKVAYHCSCAAGRVLALEDARADKHTVHAKLHQQPDVSRGGQPARGEGDHRQPAGPADLLDQLDRDTHLLGIDEDLIRTERLELTHLGVDVASVTDSLDHVAGAGVALEPDHGRALGDAAEGLAQVLRAAHERDGEVALVDVVRLVGRSQHLRFVNAVDAQGLENLGGKQEAREGEGGERKGVTGSAQCVCVCVLAHVFF